MPVVVQGAVAARKALKQLNPELAKQTNKEISSLLKVITTKARGFVPSESPMSGWSTSKETGTWLPRAFDSMTIRRGITYSLSPTRPNDKGFRSVATIYNKSAAGAIYETAGRKSGLTGNFSPRMGGELKGKKPTETGRLIFRAWDEDNGRIKAKVIKALEGTIEKVYAGGKAA